VKVRRAALATLAGLIAALALYLGRGFPAGLALIAGVAVGVLAVLALRTAAQLRQTWRQPPGGRWERDD
jgi:hypothetical protein